MPVPEQLSQISILRTRYPDSGKTILHQQLQQQLRILTVGLLLAHALGSYLAGIANPQLVVQLERATASNQRAGPVASIPTRTAKFLCFSSR